MCDGEEERNIRSRKKIEIFMSGFLDLGKDWRNLYSRFSNKNSKRI